MFPKILNLLTNFVSERYNNRAHHFLAGRTTLYSVYCFYKQMHTSCKLRKPDLKEERYSSVVIGRMVFRRVRCERRISTVNYLTCNQEQQLPDSAWL